MINLRYHIVSITAVFLALGIGLAFGAAFIDRVTVSTLTTNLTRIENQNENLEATNERLEQRLDEIESTTEEFALTGIPQLVDGRLDDVPVLLIATRGIDDAGVEAAATAIVAADATFGGTLWLTDRLTLTDDGALADLATILGRGAPVEASELQAQLVARLATVLVGAATPSPAPDPGDVDADDDPSDGVPDDPTVPPPPGTVDEPDQGPPADGAVSTTATSEVPATDGTDGTDAPTVDAAPRPVPALLEDLLDAGFLEFDAPASAPDGFALVPAHDARYLVISGPGAVVPDAQVLLPLVSAVAADAEPGVAGGPVVVSAQAGPVAGAEVAAGVDPAAERVRFVGPLREADSFRDRLSTVDDLESSAGVLAAVLALERGILGQYGHYGIGEGAQSLLPALPPPTVGDDESGDPPGTGGNG